MHLEVSALELARLFGFCVETLRRELENEKNLILRSCSMWNFAGSADLDAISESGCPSGASNSMSLYNAMFFFAFCDPAGDLFFRTRENYSPVFAVCPGDGGPGLHQWRMFGDGRCFKKMS